MANVLVEETSLEDIADAIRSKNGLTTKYKPAEMADAITAISGGGITPSGTKTINITQNGTITEDVTNYANAQVNVNVPQGITPTGTKQVSIIQNGTVTEDVTNYASAEISVNVPNSYSASDEGKVVSNGALVAQTSRQVTANGTYDTTLNSSVEVAVPASGITPTGTKNISTNGDHDVTQFATAHVDVPTGITPSGSQEFTQNGTYNVASLAEAVVNVASSGGGGGTYYEEVYLEFDNVTKYRSVTLPISDTSFDNYLVSYCLVQTGVYENDVLVMDEYPTLRSTTNAISYAGTNIMVKNHLQVSGKFISSSSTESSRTYQPFRGTNNVANSNGSLGGSAIDNPVSISGNNLTFDTAVNNNGRLCIVGYYTKYKFVVRGWNDPVTEASA